MDRICTTSVQVLGERARHEADERLVRTAPGVRIRRILVLVAVLALVAAACSSTDDGGDDAASGTDTTVAGSDAGESDESDESDEGDEGDEPDLPPGSTRGITDDTIRIAVLELDLTDVFGDTGADLAVANTLAGESYKVFADDINAAGGVNGRNIEIDVFGFSVINPAKTASSCIEATEDYEPLAVIAMGGLSAQGLLCLADAHDTLTIGTSFATEADLERLDGKLFIVGMNETEQYRLWVQAMHDEGHLEGKTIGIVHEDAIENVVAFDDGAIPRLEELGYSVAERVILPCEERTCTQYENGVEVLKSGGVDFVLNGMNGLSNPPLIDAAIAADYFPQWSVTPFNTAATLTEILTLDIEARRNAWDGAFSVNADPNLVDLWPEFPLPRPPNPGEAEYDCNERFDEVTGQGFPFDPTGTAENNDSRGLIDAACEQIYLLAHAMTEAGDDLDDVRLAYELQQITDWNDVLPWTPPTDDPDYIERGWGEGKFDAWNRYTLLQFQPDDSDPENITVEWWPITEKYWWTPSAAVG